MCVPELDPYATAKTNADLRTLLGFGGGERRSVPLTGTKALMLAVLEEGIRSYLSNDLRTREEAERWIMSGRHRSAFSFIVVCETLGFETSAVRGALRRLRAKHAPPKAIARSRSNVRCCAGSLLPSFRKRRRSPRANLNAAKGRKNSQTGRASTRAPAS
jgi:hypothetical protein